MDTAWLGTIHGVVVVTVAALPLAVLTARALASRRGAGLAAMASRR